MSDNETILQRRCQPSKPSDHVTGPELGISEAFAGHVSVYTGQEVFTCAGSAKLESSEPGAAHGDTPWSLNCIPHPLCTHRVRETEREPIFSKRTEDNMAKMEEVRTEK